MKLISLLVLSLGLGSLGSAAIDAAALTAATELFTQRKPREAQKAFEILAQADPKNPEVQFYLGRLALQRSDHEKGVAYLEQAVSLTPGESRYHQRLGDAYGLSAAKAGVFSKLGLANKCKAAYLQAVELDGKNIEARLGLLNYYLMAPGIAGGSSEKALEQAQAIKRVNEAAGRFAVASVHADNKHYDLAFAEYEEVLRTKPDDYAALFQTGRLAAISGQRMDHGLSVIRRCLTLTPPENQPSHAAAHWRIGFILEKKGDKPGARAAYQASLKLDPKFPQAIESLKNLK